MFNERADPGIEPAGAEKDVKGCSRAPLLQDDGLVSPCRIRHLVSASEVGPNRYRVSGCDRSVEYDCKFGTCRSWSQVTDATPPAAPGTPTELEAETSPPTQSGNVLREKSPSDRQTVKLTLRLQDQTLIKLAATPGESASFVLLRYEQVRQGKQQWAAEIARSDPASDRCVLRTPGAKFVPVAGVRAYDDLKVGERLYTLGTPSGLDLTLSDGILSGPREHRGRSFVQTTAPISPGSSGGGLFDSRANLVGITTLVLVGNQRLNQALNFAIPAEAFFKP